MTWRPIPFMEFCTIMVNSKFYNSEEFTYKAEGKRIHFCRMAESHKFSVKEAWSEYYTHAIHDTSLVKFQYCFPV